MKSTYIFRVVCHTIFIFVMFHYLQIKFTQVFTFVSAQRVGILALLLFLAFLYLSSYKLQLHKLTYRNTINEQLLQTCRHTVYRMQYHNFVNLLKIVFKLIYTYKKKRKLVNRKSSKNFLSADLYHTSNCSILWNKTFDRGHSFNHEME